MRLISDLFESCLSGLHTKYKYIYIAIDIHGTIFQPSRNEEEMYNYIWYAKEALQKLSNNENFKLIIFSSSYPENIKKYVEKLKNDQIHIDYIMENPEIESNRYANFTKKFYYDILLDDKAGFEPNDWFEIYNFLDKKFV